MTGGWPISWNGCPPWLRLAVEFRHPSWHDADVFALLAAHGAAYCVMSGAGLPCVLQVTADFAYVRLHGPDHDHLYAGSYSDADLRWWADRIREWNVAARTCSCTSTTMAARTRSATPGCSAPCCVSQSPAAFLGTGVSWEAVKRVS